MRINLSQSFSFCLRAVAIVCTLICGVKAQTAGSNPSPANPPTFGRPWGDSKLPVLHHQAASAYVPLDSWVYDAFDTLAARARISTAFSSIRPWTRRECARLVVELGDTSKSMDVEDDLYDLRQALEAEFRPELDSIGGPAQAEFVLEEVYARATGIAGDALTDGYHFGQTLYNDYGRPYQRGFNAITGFSARGGKARWGFYLRGEYQHSPGAAGRSAAVRNFVATVDAQPVEAPRDVAQVDRFRLQDAYISYHRNGWQISLGKQSLWWAPNSSGSLMFSNNAEPIWMLRLNKTTPGSLPWILHHLGPLRGEGFIGRLDGHKYVQVGSTVITGGRQPLIHGVKINFKPTPNFDFGVSVTTIFAGAGVPFTASTLLRSFGVSNTIPGQPSDPGDRRSGFDFRYRLPYLRDKLTLYADSYAEDEISPLAFPRRSAFNLGLFAPRMPFADRLSVRAEGFYTDLPGLRGLGFFYFNFHYLGGYTNRENLIGHWVGRQGSGVRVDAVYRLQGKQQVELSFRNSDVSPGFVPGGGSARDITARVRLEPRPGLEARLSVQQEKWFVPLLDPRRRNNLVFTVDVRLKPRLRKSP